MRKILKFLSLGLVFYLALIYLTALLPKEALLGARCLPGQLKDKKHNDYYLLGTKWIPRYVTSWCLVEPPVMLFGSQKNQSPAINGKIGPSPLPEKGSWQFSIIVVKKNWPLVLPYFALTTKTGLHFRIGCRWDDTDHYYVFPSIALRYLRKDHK